MNEPLCSRCNRDEAQEEHTCPYEEEMSYNTEYEDLSLCDCCDDCQSNCAGDI